MTESEKQPVRLKRKRLSTAQLRKSNFAAGARAENLALQFLKQKRYSILEQNLQINNFEVDLIAYDPEQDELVFVEVKQRRNRNFGEASQAVDWRKRLKMQRVAASYIREKGYQKAYRFDIIAVIGKVLENSSESKDQISIKHYQNITW